MTFNISSGGKHYFRARSNWFSIQRQLLSRRITQPFQPKRGISEHFCMEIFVKGILINTFYFDKGFNEIRLESVRISVFEGLLQIFPHEIFPHEIYSCDLSPPCSQIPRETVSCFIMLFWKEFQCVSLTISACHHLFIYFLQLRSFRSFNTRVGGGGLWVEVR